MAAGGIQVIALTSFKETELVQGALEAAAIGYLLRNVSAGELVNAGRRPSSGYDRIPPR